MTFINKISPINSNSFNTSHVEELVAKKEYTKIVKDSNLFWTLYCKSCATADIKFEKTDPSFSVCLKDRVVFVSGKNHIIEEVQDSVEEIRKLLEKGIETKNDCEILPIRLADKIFLKQNADVIDLKNWLDAGTKEIFSVWFRSFVKPCLPAISQDLGATYSEMDVIKKVLSIDDKGCMEKIQGIKIEWIKEDHLVYPIIPKKIAKTEDLQKLFYSTYQDQILCDLTLVGKDGEIKLHSPVLYISGGDVMKAMLTAPMQESEKKKIEIKNFSITTIKTFVDFVYLGEEGLQAEKIRNSNIDLLELFEMAHLYQNTSLVDCCTNVISLLFTKKDAEIIKEYANTYENRHLQELYDYYKKNQKPDLETINLITQFDVD